MDLLEAREALILQDPENAPAFCTTKSITYFNILLGLLGDNDCATVKAQAEEALERYNSYAHGMVDRMLQEGVISIRGVHDEKLSTSKILNEEVNASIIDEATSIDFEPGIEPSIEIDEGTPLHMAAFCGNWKTAMTLIEAGANVDAMIQMGRTPLSLTVRKGEEVIAWLLFSKGARLEPKDAASGVIVERFEYQRLN